MNLRTTLLTIGAAGVLGFGALAAGCGSDDEAGSTGSTTAAADEDAATTTTAADDDEATAEGGDETTSVAASGPALKVDMGEFFYKPDALSATAGGVEIDATNIGGAPHELVVAKTNDAPDKLPTAADGSVDESALDVPGEVEEVEPGASGTAVLDLQPGKYVMFCNLPGHYAGGMYGSLTVK